MVSKVGSKPHSPLTPIIPFCPLPETKEFKVFAIKLKPNDSLYWNWQYTKNVNDETQKSYKKSHNKFIKDTKLPEIK